MKINKILGPGLARATRKPGWKWTNTSHNMFEKGQARILAVTWNMAGQSPRERPDFDISKMLYHEYV